MHGVPNAVRERLKERARPHRRSPNQGAVCVLEASAEQSSESSAAEENPRCGRVAAALAEEADNNVIANKTAPASAIFAGDGAGRLGSLL